MADGEQTTGARSLRRAVPEYDGPLVDSGAAPDLTPDAGDWSGPPRPRQPAETPTPLSALPRSDTGPTGSGDPASSPGRSASATEADKTTDTSATEADKTRDTGATTPHGAPAGDDPKATSTPETPGDATVDPTKVDLAEPNATDEPGATEPGATEPGATEPEPVKAAPVVGRHRRTPRTLMATTTAAVRAWSRRPSGRVALPALLLLSLVAVSGTAGAVLIPATAGTPRPAPTASTTGPDTGPAGPGPGQLFPTGNPLPTGLAPGPAGPGPTQVPLPGPLTHRPSDILATWAQQVGTKTGIPASAMQAYGYAELMVAQSNPNCRLTWTTLAAIGSVESDHGRANGASVGADGKVAPKIFGLSLDGKGGRQRIMDTDGGVLDEDPVYDRAMGPMQFIPTTWNSSGADADNDGVRDPHDIDDAALAAGNYLCANGRNLSIAQDWWNAILSYNDVRPYAQAVYDKANEYGTASKT